MTSVASPCCQPHCTPPLLTSLAIPTMRADPVVKSLLRKVLTFFPAGGTRQSHPMVAYLRVKSELIQLAMTLLIYTTEPAVFEKMLEDFWGLSWGWASWALPLANGVGSWERVLQRAGWHSFDKTLFFNNFYFFIFFWSSFQNLKRFDQLSFWWECSISIHSKVMGKFPVGCRAEHCGQPKAQDLAHCCF